jgi:hypothetical protein
MATTSSRWYSIEKIGGIVSIFETGLQECCFWFGHRWIQSIWPQLCISLHVASCTYSIQHATRDGHKIPESYAFHDCSW